MADPNIFSSPLASWTPTPPSSGSGGILGSIFGGPNPLPGEFQAVKSEVPALAQSSDALKNFGYGLLGQGGEALGMAQRGELTAPQQAELGRFQTGLTNQARQQFYGMGRTPDKDTAFIGTTADIDQRVNAMAQQQIQSTIALGLGELSSGSSLFGQALGFDQAAINALIQSGQAQIHSDEAYRKSLTEAFSAIGKIFGSILGGPVGGQIGEGITNLFGGGGTAGGGWSGWNPNVAGGWNG